MKHLSLIALTAALLASPALAETPAVNADNAKEMSHEISSIKDVPHAVEMHEANELAKDAHHEDSEDHSAANAHGDAHHDEVKGLPQLDPTWYVSQFFWLAVTFTMMYIPFRFKVLPDLSSVIERRREKIEGDLIAAQRLKEEAENTHKAYEKIVVDARQESSALFARVEEKIKELEQTSFNDFFKSGAKKVANAEEEVANAKEKAMDEVNDVAADTAILAAEKLVGIKADKNNAVKTLKDINKKAAA